MEDTISVPPHTFVELLATANPAGSASVKLTPVRSTVLFVGLVMVKVSDAVAFSAILEGLNTFTMVGGAATVMVATAGVPGPPSFEVTTLVVLFFIPAIPPANCTLKLHESPPERLTPDRPTVSLIGSRAGAVPLQSPIGVADRKRPGGRLSVNPIPVSVTFGAFGFLIINVSVVIPFSGMLLAPNIFVMLGGATTVVVAVEVFPVPPFVETTVTLTVFAPAVVPCTATEPVHEPLAA